MFNNFPINEKMHIHSLNSELREATILKRLGDNDYLAEFNGVKCHAIYNPFVNKFYVDDKVWRYQGAKCRAGMNHVGNDYQERTAFHERLCLGIRIEHNKIFLVFNSFLNR